MVRLNARHLVVLLVIRLARPRDEELQRCARSAVDDLVVDVLRNGRVTHCAEIPDDDEEPPRAGERHVETAVVGEEPDVRGIVPVRAGQRDHDNLALRSLQRVDVVYEHVDIRASP